MENIIQEWLNNFSHNTKEAYSLDMSIFCRWMKTQKLSLDTITLGDIRRWGRTVGTSPADRRRVAAVKSFFKHAFNQEYITSNIGRCLTLPKKHKYSN